MTKLVNFGGEDIRITDPDTNPDPFRDTGKTCLGGGVHCLSASSCNCNRNEIVISYNMIV